jgi:hypothetical protein
MYFKDVQSGIGYFGPLLKDFIQNYSSGLRNLNIINHNGQNSRPF